MVHRGADIALRAKVLAAVCEKMEAGVRVRIGWKAKRTGVVQAGDRHRN